MNTDFNSNISWKTFIPIQIVVLVTIIVTVFFSYLGAFPFSENGIYRILPGDILLDFLWLYLISIFVGAVVYIATPHLSVFFWKIHSRITGNNFNYYIQKIDSTTTSSFTLRRMLLPGLVALGLSYSISNVDSAVVTLIVTESFDTLATEAQTIVSSISLLFILLLLASFIVLIFSPMWLMQDKGLVCERKLVPRATADIDGVGNWYLKLLKGFAGISTLVAYVFTIIQTVEWYRFVLISPPEGGFSLLIFLIPLVAVIVSPILALGPISLIYVLYEKSLGRNLTILDSRVNKSGLSNVIIDLKKSS